MTDLSPQAQAVMDAFNERHELCGPFDGNWQELCLAAALRAAADQVVPENYDPPRSHYPEAEAFADGKCCKNEVVRDALLAIAAELEGQ